MICLNCKTQLGCGCQVRKASNGASCCSNCITAYENSLKKPAPVPPPVHSQNTAPSEIKVSYTPKAIDDL